MIENLCLNIKKVLWTILLKHEDVFASVH